MRPTSHTRRHPRGRAPGRRRRAGLIALLALLAAPAAASADVRLAEVSGATRLSADTGIVTWFLPDGSVQAWRDGEVTTHPTPRGWRSDASVDAAGALLLTQWRCSGVRCAARERSPATGALRPIPGVFRRACRTVALQRSASDAAVVWVRRRGRAGRRCRPGVYARRGEGRMRRVAKIPRRHELVQLELENGLVLHRTQRFFSDPYSSGSLASRLTVHRVAGGRVFQRETTHSSTEGGEFGTLHGDADLDGHDVVWLEAGDFDGDSLRSTHEERVQRCPVGAAPSRCSHAAAPPDESGDPWRRVDEIAADGGTLLYASGNGIFRQDR